MRFLNKLKIGVKLPLMLVAISVVALSIMGATSYREARKLLEAEAHQRLERTLDQRAKALAHWSESLTAELRTMAVNQAFSRTMRDLMSAWKRLGDEASAQLQRNYVAKNPYPAGERYKFDFDGDINDYSMLHRREHPGLVTFAQEKGIFDIYLIRPDGTVLYTLRKEETFAANLRSPELKEGALARLFETVLKEKSPTPVSSAFMTEARAEGERRLLYLALPLRSAEGVMLGVLAISSTLDELNTVTTEQRSLGASGRSYIVDAEGRLQTPVRDLPDTGIGSALSNPAISAALGGMSGKAVFEGLDGKPAQSVYKPIEILEKPYALVVEQPEDELYEPATALARKEIFNASWLIALLALMSIWMTRAIARPLQGLVGNITAIAEGRHDLAVAGADRGDEVGDIAAALENLRDDLARSEAAQREATIQGTAFRNSSAPLMLLDEDLQLTYVNAAMARLVGERVADFRALSAEVEAGALTGRHLAEIFPLDRETEADLRDSAMLPMHRDVALGDGRYGVDFTEISLPGHGRIGYVVEWREVTELRMNRAFLAAINNTQLVMEFSADGKVSRANANIERALGVMADDLIGRAHDAVIQGEGASAGFWPQLQNLEPVIGRFRLQFNGCAPVIAEGSVTPVPDRDGLIQKVVLIGNDITQAQAALDRAQAENEAMLAGQRAVVEALRIGVNGLAEGDLRANIGQKFPPEYEQLRNDFNAAVENLAEAMQVVIENSQTIDGEAQEISNAAADLSKRTEQQAATLAQTATSLDQLTSSVRAASADVNETDRMVAQMRVSAESSGRVVSQAVSAMGEIAESSEQISRIIGVIDDIAFQTNLLALNAGVEAARAGDAGRGFAVVASEVRALAQRSSEAARKIYALISTSANHVQRGVDLVGETGRALEVILTSVNDISTRVSQIASSAREQAAGLSEINSAVIQLDQVTQQNAAMFEETTAASQSLSRSAQSLNHTTAQFQTHEARAVEDMPGLAADASTKTRAAHFGCATSALAGNALALDCRAEAVADDWEYF